MPRSAGTLLRMRRNAQGARVGSVLKGTKSFRRLLKQLPDEMRIELAHVLEDTGPRLLQLMQARAPRKTGALRAGLKWKVLRRSLRLQVGLLGTKRGRAKLFYGFILNFGRKAQTARGIRQAQRAIWQAGIISGQMRASRTPAALTYQMRIGRIAPMHFVTGVYPNLRNMTAARLRYSLDRTLARITARVGDE